MSVEIFKLCKASTLLKPPFPRSSPTSIALTDGKCELEIDQRRMLLFQQNPFDLPSSSRFGHSSSSESFSVNKLDPFSILINESLHRRFIRSVIEILSFVSSTFILN